MRTKGVGGWGREKRESQAPCCQPSCTGGSMSLTLRSSPEWKSRVGHLTEPPRYPQGKLSYINCMLHVLQEQIQKFFLLYQNCKQQLIRFSFFVYDLMSSGFKYNYFPSEQRKLIGWSDYSESYEFNTIRLNFLKIEFWEFCKGRSMRIFFKI